MSSEAEEHLKSSWLPIELECFNNNPPAGLILSVRPSGGVLAPVPPEDLSPPQSATTDRTGGR